MTKHSSQTVFMALWLNIWSTKLKSFMHRLLHFWGNENIEKKRISWLKFLCLASLFKLGGKIYKPRWACFLPYKLTWATASSHEVPTGFEILSFFLVTYVKIHLIFPFMKVFNISLILISLVSKDWKMIVLVFNFLVRMRGWSYHLACYSSWSIWHLKGNNFNSYFKTTSFCLKWGVMYQPFHYNAQEEFKLTWSFVGWGPLLHQTLSVEQREA